MKLNNLTNMGKLIIETVAIDESLKNGHGFNLDVLLK